MKLNDIQNEGIGDSLKTAGKAISGVAGKVGQTIGSTAPTLGVLGTAFARSIGFDASQGEVGSVQKGIAKKQFIGNFVQKMLGFISSTQEAVKDDLNAIIKQEQQKQAQQQAQQQAAQRGMPTMSPGGIIMPGATSARPKESIDFDNMLKIVLKESQATDQFIAQYAGIIENAIKSYLGNTVGNLGPQIKNSSNQIAQMIVAEKNYVGILEDLGSAIFDQYYTSQRTNFTRTHPAADVPLSSDAEQVLAALKKLHKKEQQVVIQKLEKGGNLF